MKGRNFILATALLIELVGIAITLKGNRGAGITFISVGIVFILIVISRRK